MENPRVKDAESIPANAVFPRQLETRWLRFFYVLIKSSSYSEERRDSLFFERDRRLNKRVLEENVGSFLLYIFFFYFCRADKVKIF